MTEKYRHAAVVRAYVELVRKITVLLVTSKIKLLSLQLAENFFAKFEKKKLNRFMIYIFSYPGTMLFV